VHGQEQNKLGENMIRLLNLFKPYLTTALFAFSINHLHGQTWSSPPTTLSDPYPVFDADAAQIAVSPSGNYATVWFGPDVLNFYVIQAVASADGITWNTPQTISPTVNVLQRAFNPQITASVSGDFVTVWEWKDAPAGFFVIQSSKSADGGLTWSPPATISVTGVDSFLAQIAVSPAGRYVATWRRGAFPNYIVQASTSTDGLSWTVPVNISVLGVMFSGPQIAVDPSGNFVISWSRNDGSNHRVQTSSSSNGTAWSLPATISPALEDSIEQRVAASSSGRFVVAWSQNEALVKKIKASTSIDGLNWSAPSDLTPVSATFIAKPDIAVDPTGKFIVVWPSTISGSQLIRSSSSTDGVNWTPVVDISVAGEQAFDSQVTSNPQGGFISVWDIGSSPNNFIRSSISSDGITWSTPTAVSPTGDIADPQVAVSSSGKAVVVWEFNPASSGYQIDSAYAILLEINPPTRASGRRVKNRFLTQIEFVNQLQWTPSSSQDISAYNIYRDGALIASVSNTTFSYNDHRGTNKSPVLYGITTVDSSGEESNPITFIVQ
jgi:hypothetical protein